MGTPTKLVLASKEIKKKKSSKFLKSKLNPNLKYTEKKAENLELLNKK